MLRGSPWRTNFESDFQSADDAVPRVIEALLKLKPLGMGLPDFFKLIRLLFRKDRKLHDMCNFFHLEEEVHRGLLTILFSLLLRSPANRASYEAYPRMFGMPDDEEVGKGNIYQKFRIAKRLSATSPLLNQYVILLYSPRKTFLFGDGILDWLTPKLTANRIDGRTLITLTPNLCVYFCTPRLMRTTPNCASIIAAPWMVDWVNNLVQIHSRTQLFFTGGPPVLSASFRQRQFLQLADRTDPFVDLLDEVANFLGAGFTAAGRQKA